jgi:hypothetical protein
MNIVEILGVNLEPSMKPFQHDDRFVAYEPGGPISEPMPHRDAVRVAAGMSASACVGFLLSEEPEPDPAVELVTIDYTQPLPSYLSRRKRTKLNLIQPNAPNATNLLI